MNSAWADIQALGDLPALEHLNLSRNKINCIAVKTGGVLFPRLRILNLSRNNLTSWTSINELALLPALEELIVAHNPLFDGEKGLHVRQSIISRLPKLTRLNKSDISDQERIIAERFYLANHAKDFWATKSTPIDGEIVKRFDAEHPTYALLVSKHGEPEQPKATTVALKV